MTTRHFNWLTFAVVVLALLLREYFVLVTEIPSPRQGDSSQYMLYAANLLMEGTFSGTLDGPVVADAYRSPGYPLFLAAFMRWDMFRWMELAQQAQAILSTLTVLMTVMLARSFMPRGWALAAGLLVAVWPHNIASSGFILSETLFGFTLTAALLLASRCTMAASVGAGVVFGLAYLVNPIVALLPVVLLAVFWRDGRAKQAVAMLLCSLVFVGAWGVRNATIDSGRGSDRVYTNFVQGSWPEYHLAFQMQTKNVEAAKDLKAMEREWKLLQADHGAGLSLIADRMAKHPAAYAEWYIGKPFVLWDWDIRVGWGDVYSHTVDKSPLDKHPLLVGMKAALRFVNPAIFAMALVLSVLALVRPAAAPLRMLAVAFLYFTALHTVLQAEPRYSIPYRPIELMLAVAAVAVLARSVRVLAQSKDMLPGGTCGALDELSGAVEVTAPGLPIRPLPSSELL